MEDDSRYYEVWLNSKTVVKVKDLTAESLQEVLDSTPVKFVKVKTKQAIIMLFNRAVKRGNFKLVG